MESENEMRKTIESILAGGNPFEDSVMERMDVQNLFYSCVVDEQRQMGLSHDAIKEYWLKELSNDGGGHNYNDLCTRMEKYAEIDYPSGIALENNTICNARCTNCTHEMLISKKMRPSVNAPIEQMRYRIRKTKLIHCLLNSDGRCNIDLTGFGEPLINPHILEMMEYARHFFDGTELTSNASLLTEEWLSRYLKLDAKRLNLSLSYFDKNTYEKEVGLPYERTINNIRLAFRVRNKMNSKTRLTVHIFDNQLNDNGTAERFKAYFEPYKQNGDLVYTRDYDEMVKNGLETRNVKRDTLVPCFMLWTTIMVDVSGNVFPCCHCVWIPYDEAMCVGRIEDDPEFILKKILSIRNRHRNGEFGKTCKECALLYEKHAADFINVRMPEDLQLFVKRHERLYLYGAGGVGAKMYRLLHEEKISVEAFLETETERKEYLRHNIVGVNAFKPDEKTGVIITVGDSDMAETIKETLIECGLTEKQIYTQSMFD